MTEQRDAAAVIDWETQFDHFNPAYSADPFPIWDDLRSRGVIAHSTRFRGMHVPTSYDDVVAVAHDPDTFSSRSPIIAAYGAMSDWGVQAPPISSDPPEHTALRRLLLPWFAPKRIEALRPTVTELADSLIDRFVEADGCDAALDYARHIPVRIIADMLGVPQEDDERFFGWVHQLLELAPFDFNEGAEGLMDFFGYFIERVVARRRDPGDDIISYLVTAELDDGPLDDQTVLGICLLLLLAGIDTTWSSIGAGLWHLAQHPDDRDRLHAEPDLWPVAIEELLRAYAPVTMAREVASDTTLHGCPMHAGDPLLLPFPAANRDPAAFPDADRVVIDRAENRHVAFGAGIHRCLGSNLARLEVGVAIQRFVERVPEFSLADPDAVAWSMGQVRGPRQLPLRFAR